MKTLRAELPNVHARLLPECFDGMVPVEKLATCGSCAMACPGSGSLPRFSPSSKCCTYFPALPNYLVGGILRSNSLARNHVAEKISKRVGISPMGLYPSKLHLAIYQQARELSFGRSDSLLCPFFVREGGLCGIWEYRDAVCSTYFCKSVGGVVGKTFWNEAKDFLSAMQTALSIYAAVRLCDESQYSKLDAWTIGRYNQNVRLSPDDIAESVDANYYTSIWGRWERNEEEYFIRCYEIVEAIEPSQMKNIMGDELQFRIGVLKGKLARYSGIPPVLMRSEQCKRMRIVDSCYAIDVPELDIHMRVSRSFLDAFDGVADTSDILRRFKELDSGSDIETVVLLYHQKFLIDKR